MAACACHEPEASGIACGRHCAWCFAGGGLQQGGRRSRRHRRCRRRGHRFAVGALPTRPTRSRPIPPDAECGKLSVPVDYSKPDGDVAQMAMIRFKATGDKIGSLVINPGGPGESGVESAVNSWSARCRRPCASASTWSASTRGGSARSTPAVWCNSDADNDRLRADPQVDYSPEGVEHIDNETKAFVQRCVDKLGKEFLANVGTANVVKDLDAIRVAVGDDKLTYLGFSYGTRIGGGYAEEFPQNVRAMVLDGAIDPNADPIEADIRQAAAFQTGVRRLRRRLRQGPELSAGYRPRQGRRRLPEHGRPAGGKAGQDQGSAWPGLQRRARRHDPAAVLADPVARSHRRAERTQSRPWGQAPAAVRRVHEPRRRRALRQCDRRAGRGQLRRPARR